MTTATIDGKVKQIIANVRNLPTPPIVFHQIQKVINEPNVSARQIASILSEDPAMSVKVLKLTNSAFYGLSREIDSVKQAVVIVGLEAIRNLVLSASVLDMFKKENTDQEFQDKFWRHSLAVAVCGRMLARKLRARGMIDPDAAFSSGLLHDVGKILMCCFLPDEFAKVKEALLSDKTSPLYEVEEQALGYNHCQVGRVLAGQWKLPQRPTNAITYHHLPQDNDSEDPIAYIIHISDYVAKKTFYSDDEDDRYQIGELSSEIKEYMEVDDEMIDGYCEDLKEEYLKAETFMKMVGL